MKNSLIFLLVLPLIFFSCRKDFDNTTVNTTYQAINSKIMLTTGIQFRYSPGNFTNNEAPIHENYHLLGGQLGLKCNF